MSEATVALVIIAYQYLLIFGSITARANTTDRSTGRKQNEKKKDKKKWMTKQ